MGVDDRYTLPGSGGVLRNQYGFTSQADVDRAMNMHATVEWAVLVTELIPDRLDFAYLSEIHRRFFGEVVGDDRLSWAGEIRSNAAPMGATDTGIVYADENFIPAGLDDVFGSLARDNYLVGLDQAEFFDKLADSWGYLTQVHPFRDGNTRSQTALIDRLATHAGHPIAWTTIDVDQLRTLRLAAITRHQPLATYLSQHAVPPADLDQGLAESVALMRAAFPTPAQDAARRPVTEEEKQPPRQPPGNGLGYSGGIER